MVLLTHICGAVKWCDKPALKLKPKGGDFNDYLYNLDF